MEVDTLTRLSVRSHIKFILTLCLAIICAGLVLFCFKKYILTTSPIVEVDEHTKRVTLTHAGGKALASFTVTNRHNKPVTIYAAATTCGCATISDLPMTIQPGKPHPLDFVMYTKPDQAGQVLSQIATLYTDAPTDPIKLEIQVSIETK